MKLPWLRFGARRSELGAEIEAHLKMAAADKQGDGVPAEEAQREAQREFGNIALIKDRTREIWGWLWWEHVFNDIRYALRQFQRAPAFAATVIGTFALGIGAAAAMFTVVDHTLLRPLPYAEAERLVEIKVFNQRGDTALLSAANIQQWRDLRRDLDHIAAYRLKENRNFLQGNQFSMQVEVTEGDADLFETLGVRPLLGAGFQPTQSANAILLSETTWQSAYGGDPAIVGKAVRINHSSFAVVGVMPAGFRFPMMGLSVVGDLPEAWVPFDRQDKNTYEIIARMANGATITDAEAELNARQKQLATEYAGTDYRDRPSSVQMHKYADMLVPSDRKRALLILLAASGALWLIAAMNVTNLLLARSTVRRREIAMRGALGASRRRVMQQLVVEGLLLSGAAGGLGIFLAIAAIEFSRSAIPVRLHMDLSYQLNATMLVALCGITLLSGLLSSAWPAFLAARAPIEPSLRRDGRQGGGQNGIRSLLVIAQISISLALLAACGWLLHSIYLLRQVPLGFRTDHVLVVSLAIPAYQYEHRSITAEFYQPLLERVQHLPGVQAAGLLTRVPLSPGFAIETRLRGTSSPPGGNERPIVARFQVASQEIQRVLGLRMWRGRYFADSDTATAEPVVVVNRAFARAYAPDRQNPGSVLGQRFPVLSRWATVVGVLDEERQESLTVPVQPEIVACIPQLPSIGSDDGTAAVMEGISMDLALRTQSPLSSVIPALRAAMAQADLKLTNADLMTMDQIVEDSYGNQRVAAHLLETFAGIALLLCVAGIYGLLSYNVSQRTRELGVRLALGAPRLHVLWLVLRQTIALVMVGVALGVGLALASGRLVQSLLFGVHTDDAWTLAIVAGVLLASALIAAWQPARRSARVNPVEALRAE